MLSGGSSLTLPRVNAHRAVIVAAALTTAVAAALASTLAIYAGLARPRTVQRHLIEFGWPQTAALAVAIAVVPCWRRAPIWRSARGGAPPSSNARSRSTGASGR